jgi:two-component system sensor histidine kinase PilS (NtrC family)
MTDEDKKLRVRLRWLMLSRIAIATFLLAHTSFIEVKSAAVLPQISLASLYLLVVLAYFIFIFYLFLQKLIKNAVFNLYIQVLCDIALITLLVYITGSIRSIYSVFYPLVIIYSVLFLGRSGGIIAASTSSILYGSLVGLEFYEIIYPLSDIVISDYRVDAGYVFSRIFIHILSFYFIALLAIFVVEQEKKTRKLLLEKENAFEQLDLLHKSIIESIASGILTVDLMGKIKSFNRAAEDITGFSFAEVENKNITQVFPNYPDLVEKIKNGSDKDLTKRRIEIVIPGKENTNLTLGCSISPLVDHKQAQVGDILIFQDLSSIKKMEEALEKNRRLAFIGEMAAGLAHEMRNPLASISGSIQVLKQGLALKASDEKLMQIVLRGKDQLENFIRDFLLLTRPTPGSQEIVNMEELIEDVLESLSYIPEWHDDIKIAYTSSGEALILANKTEMRQIVWNLILNAVQAMPNGGRLSIQSRSLTLDQGERLIELSVADSGCGIEGKEMGKIFQPFYTTKERGTGLGLAIVNRVIERYAGSIKVISKPAEGTTCVVRLPGYSNFKSKMISSQRQRQQR